eukprot:12817854-Heterocapsa_arctica.AAC.1
MPAPTPPSQEQTQERMPRSLPCPPGPQPPWTGTPPKAAAGLPLRSLLSPATTGAPSAAS